LKLLRDILYKVELLQTSGSTDIEVADFDFDSRKVGKNWLFVAIAGLNSNGHNFINQALERGATSVICEKMPEHIPSGITFVMVKCSQKALGLVASNFYDNPSEKIQLVGITGTNGKTTVVTMLHRLFTDAGYHCGLISTIKNLIANREIESKYTTPDPKSLNQLLSEMVLAGCQFAFMEVSSHAIDQQRIAGIRFAGAVFTNLTHDHLDYHKTFDAYLKAKKTFFDNLDSKAFAITNQDDKNGSVMVQNCKARKKTYSIRTIADFKGKIMENSFSGLQMIIDGKETWQRLTGEFNAYNIMAVYAVAIMLGMEKDEALLHLTSIGPTEGRFDYFEGNEGIKAIVDYAHTPDALENVLQTINKIRTRNENIITVVGCGGNRDVEKRPKMAAIAAKHSNQIIITSDNPRLEDPEKIIEEMLAGLDPVQKKKAITITKRLEAIKTACALAKSGDIILVAGKGHEKYQEINGVKYPFDDKQILIEHLKA
jgi:UDP-N-acetylmuramoyl-L-alanyl-D-glutamate--2,6-diaminopimelate ligase